MWRRKHSLYYDFEDHGLAGMVSLLASNQQSQRLSANLTGKLRMFHLMKRSRFFWLLCGGLPLLVSWVALLKLSAYDQDLQELRKQLAVLQSQQAQASADSQQRLREFQAVLSDSIRQQEALSRTFQSNNEDSPKEEKPTHRPEGNPAYPPKYSSFRTKQNVKVSQKADGSLAVESSDLSLSGKVTVVEAIRADGTVEVIPITVPPSPTAAR